MGFFFDKSPEQEQLDAYNELLEEKQRQLGELKGVNTGEAITASEELKEDIKNIEISIEQVKGQIGQAEDYEKGMNISNFND